MVETTGFAAYIVFVWDFVDWARQRAIPCGPRGSAAGSIILYCLGISDLDPVHYGLTFERFLNPERIQMPDIDMDFADDAEPERRRRSFEAIEERVSQLHGEMELAEGDEGGTEVRVTLPSYTARR